MTDRWDHDLGGEDPRPGEPDRARRWDNDVRRRERRPSEGGNGLGWTAKKAVVTGGVSVVFALLMGVSTQAVLLWLRVQALESANAYQEDQLKHLVGHVSQLELRVQAAEVSGARLDELNRGLQGWAERLERRGR